MVTIQDKVDGNKVDGDNETRQIITATVKVKNTIT